MTKPQKGAPNAKWHVAQAPTVERAFDVLKCRAGESHDVGMEWETHGALRTGRLIAWCRTCRCALPISTASPPTTAAVKEKRQAARLTQAMRKNDAQARREYIKGQLALGEKQYVIAERLGMTKQRINQIIRGRGRKSA